MQNKRKDRGKGFSLIELMAVVAVIAILAMLAVPGFQAKIVRDQIAEALPLADIAKAPIGAYWTTEKNFPSDNAAVGLPAPDKIVNNLVKSVAVEGGAIHITFGNRANGVLQGKVLSLRPAIVEDAPIVPIAWVCGPAAVPDKMKAQGTDRTNVPPAYLPFKCRGS